MNIQLLILFSPGALCRESLAITLATCSFVINENLHTGGGIDIISIYIVIKQRWFGENFIEQFTFPSIVLSCPLDVGCQYRAWSPCGLVEVYFLMHLKC